MYSVDDILRGELASEVVPCADFVSDVFIEPGAKLFDSPSWDMEFAVFDDCVNFGEVVYVEICKFGVYVVRERAPVCSVVVCVCALGWRC